MSLLAAILLFGLIILIHEFGHFLFAKLGGICVVEFSLGMGPRLFSFEKGGTRYSLKLLPFGGSCMMLGEDDDFSEEDNEEKAKKNIMEKAAFGDTEKPETAGKSEIAEKTGIAEKSEIAEKPVKRYGGIELPAGSVGVPFNDTSVWTRFSVIAAGPIFNFILAFFCAIFVISYVGFDPAEVSNVTPGYPAAEAGIQAGDVITEINGKNIKIYRDILAYTSFHPGETLKVEYKRGNETFEKTLVPKYSEEREGYLVGIGGGISKKPDSFFKLMKYSFYEVRYLIDLTFGSLKMIVNRKVSADDVAGPVRIISMIDSTVQESREYGLMVVMVSLANMCMLLSANLGIMNLLPIPALDGGRLVFIILEAVRGKPIDREKEGMVHMAGMAVLMVLMVFILFNDLRNIF